jgi:hypothetical protein
MKKYIFAIVLFLLGAGLLITFKLIGAEVAQDGTLIEPFWMVPLGYLLIVIAIVSTIVIKIKK